MIAKVIVKNPKTSIISKLNDEQSAQIIHFQEDLMLHNWGLVINNELMLFYYIGYIGCNICLFTIHVASSTQFYQLKETLLTYVTSAIKL